MEFVGEMRDQARGNREGEDRAAVLQGLSRLEKSFPSPPPFPSFISFLPPSFLPLTSSSSFHGRHIKHLALPGSGVGGAGRRPRGRGERVGARRLPDADCGVQHPPRERRGRHRVPGLRDRARDTARPLRLARSRSALRHRGRGTREARARLRRRPRRGRGVRPPRRQPRRLRRHPRTGTHSNITAWLCLDGSRRRRPSVWRLRRTGQRRRRSDSSCARPFGPSSSRQRAPAQH